MINFLKKENQFDSLSFLIIVEINFLLEEKKSKLTINVNENLLQKIDDVLKEKSINRSAFIEELLKEYIKNK